MYPVVSVSLITTSKFSDSDLSEVSNPILFYQKATTRYLRRWDHQESQQGYF